MKLINKLIDDNSDGEELEEGEIREETDDEAVDDLEEEYEEGEEEDDETDDDKDFEDDRDIILNKISSNTMVTPRLSLGGGNKKIVLKKSVLIKAKKPSTKILVVEAIKQLNERAGSSSEAIRKFIMNKNPEINERTLKIHMKRYIKNCLNNGTMLQIKRSFKLSNKHDAIKNQMENEKRKVKKEKQKEKEKFGKEKKIQKKSEKPKEKVKKTPIINKKSNKKEKDMDKSNARKRPKVNKVAAGPAKRVKVEKSTNDNQTSNRNIKTGKVKQKNNMTRKSINLVVRPTPPRPKTMKKSKTTTAATREKTNSPTASTSAGIKATVKSKKK